MIFPIEEGAEYSASNNFDGFKQNQPDIFWICLSTGPMKFCLFESCLDPEHKVDINIIDKVDS